MKKENSIPTALCPGILRGIRQVFRLVIGDILDAQEFEHLEQSLAVMSERNRTVVRVPFLNQYMTVEPAHLRNREHADSAKRTGLHRQDLALGDIGAQFPFAVTLQTIESDIAGGNVALQGASGKIRLRILGLQQTVLDQLIFYRAVGA